MPSTATRSAPPAEAVFNAEVDAWEVCERNASGERHGECRLYREDGSLKLHCHYDGGVLSGPFMAYHPGGALARRGDYAAGKLHGLFTHFANDAPGSEPLRTCCVPPGATELRVRYFDGSIASELFVDAQGRSLGSDGTPWPERAPAVPEDARFDEQANCWCLRVGGHDSPELTYRYYGLDGALSEEVDFERGRKRAWRRFDPSGTLVETQHLDADGALDGLWFRRHATSPFSDPRIAGESGMMRKGSAAGEFRFFDAAGQVVRLVNRGPALSNEQLLASPALAEWDERAELPETLAAEGRVREALCAAARRLARDRDIARFEQWLDRFVVRLTPEARAERAQTAENNNTGSLVVTVDALLLGGDPARLLRLLASLAPPLGPAALDFIEAALCLDPTSTHAYVTRALLRLERGDDAGVRADAAIVARESEPTAAALLELCRLVFPVFSFWPARDPVDGQPAELETIELDQPLSAIRRTVQLYATRLGVVRDALLARVGQGNHGGVANSAVDVPEWLPPDPSFLLPEGPLALTVYRAEITDETDEGTETSEVEIDERVLTDELGVPALMRKARADWSALTWLCWAVGLDRVALPESVNPPRFFAAAADRATTRCFRVHDQLRSAGLVSRARGVPGFVWEGVEVSELSPTLCEIAATETLELRSLFFWLLFAQNRSPFQDDLRRV